MVLRFDEQENASPKQLGVYAFHDSRNLVRLLVHGYGGEMTFDEHFAQADAPSEEAPNSSFSTNTIERISIGETTAEELDQLPFGAIQLDRRGFVLQFNSYESQLSGIDRGQAIGKQFFTDIAPCANVKEFYGRFQTGVQNKRLHEKFRYHFAFKQRPRDVTITLFYSDTTDTIWVFVRPA